MGGEGALVRRLSFLLEGASPIAMRRGSLEKGSFGKLSGEATTLVAIPVEDPRR